MTIPKSISDGSLLSTADVAKRLDVHRTTVWLWIKRGMLPSVRHGAFHGIRPQDLHRFLSIYTIAPPTKRKRKTKRKSKKPSRKRSNGKTK